jgi:hypothetical protein
MYTNMKCSVEIYPDITTSVLVALNAWFYCIVRMEAESKL